MGDYATILSCTIGSDQFNLEDYSLIASPKLDERGRIVARTWTISGEGWVEASNSTTFAQRVVAASKAFAVSGQSISIKGLNQQEELLIAAATCIGGGPHVQFEIMPQMGGSALKKRFRFSAVAEQGGEYNPSDGTFTRYETRRTRRIERPDGLLSYTYSGELKGAGAQAGMDGRLAEMRLWHPWPAWSTARFETDLNTDGDGLTYSIQFDQMDMNLPGGDGGDALGGVYEYRRERDERGQILIIHSFDLAFSGDPWAVQKMIRPDASRWPIVRESLAYTGFGERRLRAQFVVIDTTGNGGLVEWTFRVREESESPVARAVQYDGVLSALHYDLAASGIYRATVSGRAVGVFGYPIAPMPDVPGSYVLAEKPSVERTQASDYQYETAFTYSFIGTRPMSGPERKALMASMARPATPRFEQA